VTASRSRRRWRWAAAWLAALSACSTGYLQSQLAPHASLPMHARIAVLPVVPIARSSGEEMSGAGQVAPGAEAVVARELYDTLEQQSDFDIVPRVSVDQALAELGEPPSTPVAVQALASKLGAEAVLRCVITLFRERIGSHLSVSQPAAVGLDLWLYNGRDGRLLWTGSYHEVQRSLTEEVRTFPLYWERGARWLTAEELSGYAVTELVKTLPPVNGDGEGAKKD
jgi:hypothetical protein